jgi:hypothetical protein
MSKLDKILLPELYERKITSSVEKVILEKENFKGIAPSWCDKVCKLKCKNPPTTGMFNPLSIDVLIIQDYNAFDEIKFKKKGAMIEKKHREILRHIALSTLGKIDGEGNKILYSFEITNLLKCQVQGADIVKGKAPTDTILMKCRPYILEEINTKKPKLIISLNTSVTKALGIKKTNYRDCGGIVEYEGIPVVITLHPRILLMLRQNSSGQAWGSDFYSIIERDFIKAAQLLTGSIKVPNLNAAIERVKEQISIARSIIDVKNFCEILTKAGESGSIESLDTETTGLDPWAPDARLITIQLGYRNEKTGVIDVYVFPLWHRENKWYNPDEAWELIKPILLNDNVKKVLHNAKFDLLYIEITKGIRVRGVLYDTMLLLHSINSGVQGFYGLKSAIGYWLPDFELSGYETKLPNLTKKKIENDDIEGNDEEIETIGGVSAD